MQSPGHWRLCLGLAICDLLAPCHLSDLNWKPVNNTMKNRKSKLKFGIVADLIESRRMCGPAGRMCISWYPRSKPFCLAHIFWLNMWNIFQTCSRWLLTFGKRTKSSKPHKRRILWKYVIIWHLIIHIFVNLTNSRVIPQINWFTKLEYSVAVTHSKEHLTNRKKESIGMTQHTEAGHRKCRPFKRWNPAIFHIHS